MARRLYFQTLIQSVPKNPHRLSWGFFRFMLPLVLVTSLFGACTSGSSGGTREARSSAPIMTITFEAQANTLSIAEDVSTGDSAGTLAASTDGPDSVSFSIAGTTGSFSKMPPSRYSSPAERRDCPCGIAFGSSSLEALHCASSLSLTAALVGMRCDRYFPPKLITAP